MKGAKGLADFKLDISPADEILQALIESSWPLDSPVTRTVGVLLKEFLLVMIKVMLLPVSQSYVTWLMFY